MASSRYRTTSAGSAAWEACRSAWPDVLVDKREFIARLEDSAEAVHASTNDDSEIVLHAVDLYLAFGAVRGDLAAIREIDRICTVLIESVSAIVEMKKSTCADALQLVRERLYVGRGGHEGKLAEYSGRGALKAWLRVVIVRTLLNQAFLGEHEVSLEPKELSRLIGTAHNVELTYMKDTYAKEFRAAFVEAVRLLTARDQLLLRMAFVDGQTIQAIASFFQVHRETATRWLSRAETALYEGVREHLKAKLRIGDSTFDSILRLVRSELELTLESCFPPARG